MRRKWHAEEITEGPNAGTWEVYEDGTLEKVWPEEGREAWTLCTLNPGLETFAETRPEIAGLGWYARMMAAAPDMRRLLQKVAKDDYDWDKMRKAARALIEAIDDGIDYEEMETEWK